MASPDGPYRAGATTAVQRQEAIDSMRGLGQVIDSIIDEGPAQRVIVYVDTSVLVRAFLPDEDGHDQARESWMTALSCS